MNKLLAWTITLAVLSVTVACKQQDQRCAHLPDGSRYCLQPTTALPAFDAQQIVEANFNGHKETLIVEMESSPTGLSLVGLTPFGHKILQINYNNRVTTATTSPSERLDPVLLVALLQLTLWPADAVRKGLDAPMSLVETNNTRRILSGNDTLLNISRVGTKPPYKQMRVFIPSIALELDIKSLEAPNQHNEP